jgi:hypothetical protein
MKLLIQRFLKIFQLKTWSWNEKLIIEEVMVR